MRRIRPNMPPPQTYEVKSIVVNASFHDQVAETQVTQTIYNPSSRDMEIELFFPLPAEGAVQSLTLMVDGKEMPGRLLPKDEARRIYEDIVRRKQDPALMEYVGYGLFKTSVFPVPARGERSIVIRYSQLCTKDRGVVNYTYPFGTQKFSSGTTGKVSFNARIQSTEAIKNIYSPSDQIQTDRSSNRDVRISFEQSNVRRDKDFRLAFSTENGEVGMSVLSYRPKNSEDGYFMLLASPEIKDENRRPLPKTVIFVLDRSGSMEGKKIDQAKEALKFVLNNLREDDLFNIVDYDDGIQTYKPELQRYSSESRRDALNYVDKIRSGGGTNINEAMVTAMNQIKGDSRPNYVLFMTDGLPTSGNTNELQIAQNAKNANKFNARVFAFGVGDDVNARLLDRIVSGNGGRSEYVSLDDNLEAKVASYYSSINSPVLNNIRIDFGNTDLNRTYPQVMPDLFEGGQLVWVGRYRQSGRVSVKITGKVGDQSKTYNFTTSLADDNDGNAFSYVEKLWATRRIGFIIDQLDLNGRNQELINELVALSTKHGILTPYTSFLADETTDLRDVSANRVRAEEETKDLAQTSGGYANAQRAAKQQYMNATTASAPAPMASGRGAADIAEAKKIEEKIQQVGNKTFFLKNDTYIESDIKPEEEAQAIVIKQLSTEYFDLARNQSAEQNQYMNMQKKVLVRLNNRVYRIDPN
jgi:Ca-activated chloride channel family protein